MTAIKQFTEGMRYFQAELSLDGVAMDADLCECYTTREEAEEDGEHQAASHDTEWQKRHPGRVSFVVREWICGEVDEYHVCTAAETV